MKEILSYWDLSLGFASIAFGAFKRYKFYIFRKKYNEYVLKNTNYKYHKLYSYARKKSEGFEDALCYLFIIAGIVFIYNRLKGNLPNIIDLIVDLIDINELLSYWDISFGLIAVIFGILRLHKYKVYAKKEVIIPRKSQMVV